MKVRDAIRRAFDARVQEVLDVFERMIAAAVPLSHEHETHAWLDAKGMHPPADMTDAQLREHYKRLFTRDAAREALAQLIQAGGYLQMHGDGEWIPGYFDEGLAFIRDHLPVERERVIENASPENYRAVELALGVLAEDEAAVERLHADRAHWLARLNAMADKR